jgi:hypothetical protein
LLAYKTILGGIILKIFSQKSSKKSFKILNFKKYDYVKVYAKYFKKYLIFKGFEPHLQIIFVLKNNHYYA